MKQTRNNNFARQFFGLAIAASMIIFAVGCSRTETSVNVNTTANTNSANTNTTAVSNTAANVNSVNSNSGNANTAAAKSIKDEILGAWIEQESGSAEAKTVFTKDEYTKFRGDNKMSNGSYRWLNDQEIEMDFGGQKVPIKITIAGDEMTQEIALNETSKIQIKYKRESANSANSGSSSPDASGIQEKANQVVGRWETMTDQNEKITLEFSQPKKDGETYAGTYRKENKYEREEGNKYVVSSDKMIKFIYLYSGQENPRIKVSISDDGKTLNYIEGNKEFKLTKTTESAN